MAKAIKPVKKTKPVKKDTGEKKVVYTDKPKRIKPFKNEVHIKFDPPLVFGPGVQAWENGIGVPCGKDESNQQPE